MVTGGIEDIVVDSILRYSRQLYICCFSLLGPKGGGIWRNGRRCGLNQIEPRYGNVLSDSSQIQGNLGLFCGQS